MEDLFLIPYRKGDKWGYCKPDKTIITPCIYDYAEIFHEGLACVKKSNIWGVVNSNGQEIISPIFDFVEKQCKVEAYVFHQEKLVVYKDKKYGVIDKQGRIVLPFIYDMVRDINEGVFHTVRNNKNYLVDNNGKEFMEIDSDFLTLFQNTYHNGLLLCQRNNKYGFINPSGNIIVPFKYDEIYTHMDGIASYALNNKHGCLDLKGNEIIPCEYDDFCFFNEGYALALKGKIWSYIDEKNNIVIPHNKNYIYYNSFIFMFKEGRACVKKYDYKWGYIDKTGQEVIACNFEEVDCFTNGHARFQKNGKYGLINESGNTILLPIHYNISEYSNGITLLEFEDQFGLIKKSGDIKIFNKYTYIVQEPHQSFCINKGLIKVETLFGEGYIDFNGKEYWED